MSDTAGRHTPGESVYESQPVLTTAAAPDAAAWLLVPVALDVLALRAGDGPAQWADTAMREPVPGGDAVQMLQADPFTDRAPRATGAYLHWAVPDALTHAEQAPPTGGEPGPVVFPALPERWLVARLSAKAGPKPRAVRAWILDAAGAAPGTPPTVTPLEQWTAPAPGAVPATPLTALGHGDFGWAAYYDNVEGRLGFHDPLTDAEGPVAYLVCGWYAHPALDPLRRANPAGWKAFTDHLADQRWRLPGDQYNGLAPTPTGLILHGSAVSIGWPGTGWNGDLGGVLSAETDYRPDPEAIRLALAESLVDALAALSAEDGDEAARLTAVRAFLAQADGEAAGATGGGTSPDGESRLTAALHAMRFGAAPDVPHQETIWQAADPRPAAEPAASAAAGTTVAGQFVGVERARPRLFEAADPVLIVQGGGRSFKHGGDGRFEGDARLTVRLGGQTVASLGAAADGGGGAPAGRLDGTVLRSGVPALCQDLLVELAALDPGSAPLPVGGERSPALARTDWWATWDPSLPPAANGGALPSPVAVTPPARPWNPLHADWELRYEPLAATGWRLGDTDLEGAPPPAVAEPARTFRGRAPLAAGPASVLAGATLRAQRKAVATGLAGPAAAPADVELLDLLGGRLDGLMSMLRGEQQGDLVGGDTRPPLLTPPPPLRAGRTKLTRLRLVDTYGQVVEMASGARSAGPPTLVPPSAAADDDPGSLILAPRFTAPARVTLRYVAADGRTDTAGATVEADDTVSPVAGFLMPDFVDGSAEFFDPAGGGLGRLRADGTGATVWEDDPARPGRPGRLGADPADAIGHPALAGLASGVVEADRRGGPYDPTALSSLLKVIDTTWWTIDFTGEAGEEHLAMLLGHPVAVLRAELLVEVDDPAADPALGGIPIEVVLGALDRFEDGLVGYLAGDDPGTLRVIDPAVLEAARESGNPLAERYVTGDPLIVRPGVPVPLTLLVAPNCQVHVRTGLLPAKAVGMRRSWVAEPLAKMTPTFRHGPVLVDAEHRRLPLPADVHGTWTWLHRADPHTWAADEVTVLPPGGAGAAEGSPPVRAPRVEEGWLRLGLVDASWEQYAVRVDVEAVSQVPRIVPGSPIKRIGGSNGGRSWSLSAQNTMELIRSGRFDFWMQPRVNGHPAGMPQGDARQIRVVTDAEGRSALTTTTAGDLNDPLLTLPETGIPEIKIFDPSNPTTYEPKDGYRRYTLAARHSGQYLDVTGGAHVVDPYVPIITWPLHGGTNQQWAFRWHDHAYFTIAAWNSGLLLTAGPLERPDLSGVFQAPPPQPGAPAATQLWQPVSTGDGHVVIYLKGTTRCLSVDGGPEWMENGLRTVVTEYQGLPNQQWKIRPVDIDTPLFDATAMSISVPQTMYTSQVETLTVRVRNTGNSAWRPEAGHALLPGGGFVQLVYIKANYSTERLTAIPVPSVVQPGQEVTITFLAAGGTSPATLTGSFRMGKVTAVGGIPGGITEPWGQPTPDRTVTVAQVTGTQLSATVAASMPPGTIVAGDSPYVWFTIQNTGTATWYREMNHRMINLHGGAGDPLRPTDMSLGTNPVRPGETTSAGAQLHPDVPGTYQLRMQMAQTAPFGAMSPSYSVVVTGMVNVTQGNGAAFPTTWVQGYAASIRAVLNAAAPRAVPVTVRLGGTVWGTTSVPQGSTVSPGVSLNLPVGWHTITVLCATQAITKEVYVIEPKETEKPDIEKIDPDKVAFKEKDRDEIPLTEDTGSGAPADGPGATPWISADDRPDVGGHLYDDGPESG
ncbi:RICIN domain-containing protein [Actinomadura craniellae]|uniref:RICIN domain-containing protein n=1 Tax=Actinomadura craniellae TaxID=2231787 RepID=UPI0011BF8607|nr:RICIN domain-containing protein [Actinomadura craniellae]